MNRSEAIELLSDACAMRLFEVFGDEFDAVMAKVDEAAEFGGFLSARATENFVVVYRPFIEWSVDALVAAGVIDGDPRPGP